jgi:hypothetical protein
VDVLAEEGTGRGAPGDALGGVGWAGEVARVAVATWIRLSSGGDPGGQTVGGHHCKCWVRMGKQSPQAKLFGGGNPPSPERAALYFHECVKVHHNEGVGGGA